MKLVASYTFSANRSDPSAPGLDRVSSIVEEWLSSKIAANGESDEVVLASGRRANVYRVVDQSSVGKAWTVTLDEPLDGGARLRTFVAIGESGTEIAVSVRMAVSSDTLAPLDFEPRTPRVVQLLLESPSPWMFQGLPLASEALELTGEAGGSRLAEILWDESRPVPVIVIADDFDSTLPPGIEEDLTRELSGLAIVAVLDNAAAHEVAVQRGREWACYGGAVRLYWPGLTAASNPLSNPLWTATQLEDRTDRGAAASRRIRDQLRRRVFEQSALAVSEAPLLQRIRSSSIEEKIERLRADVEAGVGLADDVQAELDDTNNKLETQKEVNERLRVQNENLSAEVRSLRQLLGWTSDAEDDAEIVPTTEVLPETLEEAVQQARIESSGNLVFGSAVRGSVLELVKDAGPPRKVLEHLRALSDMTLERRKGSLGMDALQWLERKGVTASSESKTVRNSDVKRRARTWDGGNGQPREFLFHTKPTTATAPDRCVRIYFDFDESRGQTIIGWVGRHPSP